ncbi:hypothetical protein OF83DRAFT_1178352 [Amylostereum chailletii]|nr:hypothetical protein OF83DRAFT_1178352 [Amylostereum chailletii]
MESTLVPRDPLRHPESGKMDRRSWQADLPQLRTASGDSSGAKTASGDSSGAKTASGDSSRAKTASGDSSRAKTASGDSSRGAKTLFLAYRWYLVVLILYMAAISGPVSSPGGILTPEWLGGVGQIKWIRAAGR